MTNLQNASKMLNSAMNWIRAKQLIRSNNRRLQVAATVSLGDKRFVSVIQIDGREFLVGGGATNVALLAQLNGKELFGNVLHESMAVPMKQPSEPKVKRMRKKLA